jgi:Cu/Zn superoxide dismutase
MWTARGLAGLGILALAACGGPEPRGQLSVVPRPELTAPPGEMSAQRLVLMKATEGEKANKGVGSIALSTEGVGVLVRIDLRGMTPGTYVLSINEKPDCRFLEEDGKKIMAGGAGAPWGPDETVVRMPQLVIGDDGSAKTEFIVPGLKISDTRDRSFVVNSGASRIACGLSV